jgi:hypothetical protein
VTIAIRPLCRRGTKTAKHEFRKSEIYLFFREALERPISPKLLAKSAYRRSAFDAESLGSGEAMAGDGNASDSPDGQYVCRAPLVIRTLANVTRRQIGSRADWLKRNPPLLPVISDRIISTHRFDLTRKSSARH